MKEGIHPNYQPTTIKCACGEVIETRSTKQDIKVEICSKCHPFFTGKQKSVSYTHLEFAAGFVGVLLAWLIHIIFMAVPIIILVTGLINAIGGKAKDLPLIGRIKMIFEK